MFRNRASSEQPHPGHGDGEETSGRPTTTTSPSVAAVYPMSTHAITLARPRAVPTPRTIRQGGEKPRSRLGVVGSPPPVDEDDRIVTDDPGVVALR